MNDWHFCQYVKIGREGIDLPSRDIERKVTRASHFWTLFKIDLMVMAGQAAEVGWLLAEVEAAVAAVDKKVALATKD